MTRQCCKREAASSRLRGLASVASAVAVALLPKCPMCLAVWLTAATGIGVSAAGASKIRWTALALSFAAGAILLRGFARRWMPERRACDLRQPAPRRAATVPFASALPLKFFTTPGQCRGARQSFRVAVVRRTMIKTLHHLSGAAHTRRAPRHAPELVRLVNVFNDFSPQLQNRRRVAARARYSGERVLTPGC